MHREKAHARSRELRHPCLMTSAVVPWRTSIGVSGIENSERVFASHSRTGHARWLPMWVS